MRTIATFYWVGVNPTIGCYNMGCYNQIGSLLFLRWFSTNLFAMEDIRTLAEVSPQTLPASTSNSEQRSGGSPTYLHKSSCRVATVAITML